MEFEFDLAKSKSNMQKHGIDFIQAQDLWLDEDRLEIRAKLVLDEARWALIGRLMASCWTAIFTVRANRVRIISVRRSRKEEEELYYDK